MRKIKLTYLTIITSVLISISPAKSQWDGGDFGGDFDNSSESYDGGDFNGGYYDQGDDFGGYPDQDSLDQEGSFYTGDGVYQPEGYEYGEDLNQEEADFDQINVSNPSHDSELEYDSVQSAETAQNKETASESLQDNLTTINNESNAADPSVQLYGANQEISSTQSNYIQNNIQSGENVENDQIANHDHNNGDHYHEHYDRGHHYHDEFGLGFGLGLGMGLGFGFTFSPFHGPFTPFGGFGYYGFSYPFSSFGIGFYNNYAFGPYRRFESSYPLGSYLVTTPVFTAPLAPTPLTRPTYIQQSEIHPAKPATPQRNDYWHYCRNPEGYYPYIRHCLGEWIKVPPQPS